MDSIGQLHGWASSYEFDSDFKQRATLQYCGLKTVWRPWECNLSAIVFKKLSTVHLQIG